ncbi:MAG: hypothetical protein JO369_08080 [Paucibacter sp.]|nr:hypothetical protein [Roseateles sp.]
MTIAERFNRFRFRRAVPAVLHTPPVQVGDDDFVLLSMVHHRDVLPYLLALKSFCRFVKPRRIVVVADPTLDESDRSTLRQHVPQIEIQDARSFHTPGIPQGGTWERLTAIADLATQNYVVQLDSDTIALRPLPEVLAAIASRVAFVLGTEDGQVISSTAEAAAEARPTVGPGVHVQRLAEAHLDQFDPAGRFRYTRGCSGFAGFAPGTIHRELLHEICRGMEAHLGTRWSDWGTEQFSSNLIVASAPGAKVLPHPKYCHPGRMTVETVFLHFIGYIRFTTGLYARQAREICRALN